MFLLFLLFMLGNIEANISALLVFSMYIDNV